MKDSRFSIEKKNILITGASGYFGKLIAFELAKLGANVLVNSRNKNNCEKIVSSITNHGFHAESFSFDITNHALIEDFSNQISGRPIHVIINNAYSGGAGNIFSSDVSEYKHAFDINITYPAYLFKNLLPNIRLAVRECSDASIINIASMYGLVSPTQSIYESSETINPPYYGASKAAMIQWTKYAACEFANESIRFNCISPGAFPAQQVQSNSKEFIKKLNMKIPLNRVGQAEEIIGPIIFLASKASSYMTGSNMIVDGGWTSW